MSCINISKRILLPFALLLILLTFSTSQLYSQNVYLMKFDGVLLSLPENIERIDLGTTIKGEVSSAAVKVINESNTTLLIANVRGSCGLSIPAWPRNPIAPGEEAIIQIRFDSNRPGVIIRNITISANTANSSTVVKVSGEVIEGKAR